MAETTGNGEWFVGYDYKEVATSRDMEALYADGYTHFGWTLDNTTTAAAGLSMVLLKFKRDRKIRNKAELTRLQRQFDSGVAAIASLERSKLTAAMITAFTVGLIGTAFFAGSTFAVTASPPNIALCVIFGIPGFVGWALPYLLFRRGVANRTAKVSPIIDKKYDEIYEVCEKASGLLGGNN